MEAVASSVPTPETDVDLPEAEPLDLRGLSCPLPIVRISQAFAGLPAGAVLEVLVTDRGALSDIPSWAKTTGNTLVEQDERGGAFRFVLRKGGPR
jgi:TusA-related sulfurtransferase